MLNLNLPLRILQAILAIIALGLNSYGTRHLSSDPNALAFQRAPLTARSNIMVQIAHSLCPKIPQLPHLRRCLHSHLNALPRPQPRFILHTQQRPTERPVLQ